MLSGNGRHRRPRQAPAFVVAAGVTGSAIAIPLLAATGASAATGTTWDKVADCESDGSWSADEGNGRYGGLQLSQKDWERYGGLTYATSADQASRSQQIAVAERVLADRGAEAWGTCGTLAGLEADSESARIDTGVAGDKSSTPVSGDSGDLSDSLRSLGLSNSSGSSGSSGGSGSGESSGSGKSSESPRSTGSAKPSASPESDESPETDESPSSPSASPSSGASSDPTDGSASPTDPQGSGTPSTGDNSDETPSSGGLSGLIGVGSEGGGKHRGDRADESTDGADSSGSSGRHASRGAAAGGIAGDKTSVVQEGSGLWNLVDSLDGQAG
ncbi:transglycosylase family protein [Streptomyces cadmiisoli]|uniref:transglycosylase family protein n=1 Tax=Streptomyces cadmiisoli TaxID=2184053 RepID=UPI0036594DEF